MAGDRAAVPGPDCRGVTTPPAANPEPAGFWQRRVVEPVKAQLRQGITPEKIALTMALGAVLGIFPILGASTFLCFVAGVWLRLNQPVIQLVNYLAYPLQLLLLLPFYRAGETLFNQPHVPIFSVTALVERFSIDPLQFLVDYGMVGLYGIVVWMLCAPVLVAIGYWTLRPVLVAMRRRVPVRV